MTDPPEVMASFEEWGVDKVGVGELSLTTIRHLLPIIRIYAERFSRSYR